MYPTFAICRTDWAAVAKVGEETAIENVNETVRVIVVAQNRASARLVANEPLMH